MLKRFTSPTGANATPTRNLPPERVTSVLGPSLVWKGSLRGAGGVRIEGYFEGEVAVRGMVIIGETGKVICENLRTNHLIIAGELKGNVTSEKLEIRNGGRLWGDVVTTGFSTEEGAFFSGRVTMEDTVHLEFEDVSAFLEQEKEENE